MTAARSPAALPLSLAGGAALLLASGIAVAALSGPLPGAVTLPGRVEDGPPAVPVRHPDGGIVAAVAVSEGAAVTAGQVLMRLDGGPQDAEARLLGRQLFGLALTEARLAALRDGRAGIAPPAAAGGMDPAEAAALLAAESLRLRSERESADQAAAGEDRQRAGLDSQIAALRAEGRAVERQRSVVAEERGDQAGLAAKGLVPAQRVRALEQELGRLDAVSAELEARLAEAEMRREALAAEADRRRLARDEDVARQLSDLAPRRAEIEERLALALARRDALLLRAPVAGTVELTPLAAPGVTLRPGETALAIAPPGTGAEIVAEIGPRDAALVRPGGTVRIRLVGQPGAATLTGTVLRRAVLRGADGRGIASRAVVKPDGVPAGVLLAPGQPVQIVVPVAGAGPLGDILRRFAPPPPASPR